MNNYPILVTSWGPCAENTYARRFLDSAHFWPKEVRFVHYVEEPLFSEEEIDLLSIPEVVQFIERHRNDDSVKGKAYVKGWSAKDLRNGYSYRFDAWKFFRKPLALLDACRRFPGNPLIWLDADVVTLKPVPLEWVMGLFMGPVTYLGRDNAHSECGFLAFRPDGLELINRWAEYYHTGKFKSAREWHDSYLFDCARLATGIRGHNLTPGGKGHVWCQSLLAEYLDHCKGERKVLGFSPEHPLNGGVR